MILEYDGTSYHGWQRQENSLSIQQVVEEALEKLTREKIGVIAAGRTDTGVHARKQVIHFRLRGELPTNKVRMGLNAYLPGDIVVKKAEEVPEKFNARFDARKRTYHYYLLFEPTAIYRNFCWQVYYRLNREVLAQLAEQLIGEHDFAAFSRVNIEAKNKICRVYESRWFREGDFFVYRIVANRFLHGMVRSIVGTMVDVARGRFTVEQFQHIFQSKDRRLAGTAAPPQGLFLQEIQYS